MLSLNLSNPLHIIFCNKIKHLYLKSKVRTNYRPASPPTFRIMKSILCPVYPPHLLLSPSPHLPLVSHSPVVSIRCSGHDWLTLRSTHAVHWPYRPLYTVHITVHTVSRYFYPRQNCLQIITNHHNVMPTDSLSITALCFTHTRVVMCNICDAILVK